MSSKGRPLVDMGRSARGGVISAPVLWQNRSHHASAPPPSPPNPHLPALLHAPAPAALRLEAAHPPEPFARCLRWAPLAGAVVGAGGAAALALRVGSRPSARRRGRAGAPRHRADRRRTARGRAGRSGRRVRRRQRRASASSTSCATAGSAAMARWRSASRCCCGPPAWRLSPSAAARRSPPRHWWRPGRRRAASG